MLRKGWSPGSFQDEGRKSSDRNQADITALAAHRRLYVHVLAGFG